MEFCYSPEHGRRCVSPDTCEDHQCGVCKKTISDCEWVVCWGMCGTCISESYAAYEREREQREGNRDGEEEGS